MGPENKAPKIERTKSLAFLCCSIRLRIVPVFYLLFQLVLVLIFFLIAANAGCEKSQNFIFSKNLRRSNSLPALFRPAMPRIFSPGKTAKIPVPNIFCLKRSILPPRKQPKRGFSPPSSLPTAPEYPISSPPASNYNK